MICQICQRECDGPKGLGLHINKSHGLSAKEYYDKFLRKSGEGVCKICQKEVAFASLGRGYLSTYCSQECCNRDSELRQIQREVDRVNAIPEANLVICLMCQKKYKGLASLGAHIVRSHLITTQAYYNRFLRKGSTDGTCLTCGRATSFQDMGTGYPNKYCSLACNKAESKQKRIQAEKDAREARKSEHVTCRVCGKVAVGLMALVKHTNDQHGMSSEHYYDAYFRKPDEGQCRMCGKQTGFIDASRGYRRYCSNLCYSHSDELKSLMSRVHSVRPSPLKGRVSPLRGREQDAEHTEKIRIAAMRRAEEHCLKYGLKFPSRGKNEIPFVEELQKLSLFKIDINFRPCGYILDGFIHELNLAIEYDEPHHTTPQQKELDYKREVNIKTAFPVIDFFRVKEEDWLESPVKVLAEFLVLIT